MVNEAVIIAGALDATELERSIDNIINTISSKSENMATPFTNAIGKMEQAMKNFAITQKVSASTMKDAWREMSTSFDAMFAAQSASIGGGNGSGNAHATNTIGALEQEIAEIKKERKEMELNSNELRAQNSLLERRKNLYKEQTTSFATKRLDSAMQMSTNKLDEAQKKLRLLEILQRRYANTTELSVAQQNKLARAIQQTKNQIDKIKPKSLREVLGMDANSIDQIAAKMRALKMIQIDPKNAAEVKSVGDAYAELRRKQAQLMGQNIQLTHSNNYLAQSFGYIRNRIVYALTLGALTNFVKQLYEVRGQYELLERSLGVLIGSFEKGTQIFNELNEMAIKSPFTLIELGTAAKQLTAYNFAANEVVDTTRRLADISAALGVPMERLTYNLGQIKAQGVLNARDARDFANAGLAIVPMLAKMYTEQKTFGDEMVTTAQVYDMMSKKMVTYGDVLKVLYRVTDEGGKFFDFQAKQANTLRVQMANLTLAYNNMLNEIGAENQGVLSGMVGGLRTLLKNWREISRAILTLVTTFGTYRAVATIIASLNSKMFVGRILVGLRNYILGIKNATGAMATFNAVTRANPIAFLISALVAAIGYFALFNNKVKETTEEMERFGENASKQIKKVENLGKVLASIEEGSSTYKKALSDLNQIVSEYGLTEIKNRDEINSKIQQTIQLIKEEGKERQYANNIAKGEESYQTKAGKAKSSLNENLLDLNDGWFGTTSKVRKEIADNADAISDIASSIIEENINLVVNKTGEEAYKGLLEIINKVRSGLKDSGLSNNAIDFILRKNYIGKAIKDYRVATEEHERYNQKIKGYYDAATKATKSTMKFTEKVNANARALRNNTEDAVSLYNRVYDIVKIAQQKHTINFDLKLSAEKPPKWMLDKSLPELRQLAERFTAVAQSGGHIKGYDREGTYQQALRYASAARQKQEEEERNARNKDKRDKDKKTRTKQSDEIAKAIKKEISLVKELQSAYDTLTKKGDSHANAIAKVQDLYGKNIELLNKDMDKFGLPRLDLSIIKGNNYNQVLAFFEKLRNVLESKGLSNLERMDAVEGVVKEFKLKADTFNLDMINKGLNNELGKLKDEYELAVELDANPEVGGMLADFMGVDVNELPRTFEEAAKMAQASIDKIFKENGRNNKIDIVSMLDKGKFDKWVKDSKLSMESELVKAIENFRQYLHKTEVDENKNLLQNWQKLLEKYSAYEYQRSNIAKNATKERIDLVNKLGSQDQKNAVAKIKTEIDAAKDPKEKERLQQELDNVISDVTKNNKQAATIAISITNKEKKETSKLDFEEFKNSDDWIAAMGDTANLTTAAMQRLIETLQNLIATNSNLDATQIKEINNAIEQMQKDIIERNPFSALASSIDNVKKKREALAKSREELRQAKIAAGVAKLTGNYYKQAQAQARIKEKSEKVKQSERELGNAQNDLSENVKSAINEFAAMYDSMTNLRNMLGDTADQAIQAGISIASTFVGIKKSADKVEKAVAILAIIKAALAAINFLAGIFGGKKDTYTPLKEQIDRLADIMNKVAEAQLEALGKMTGPRAIKKYQEIKEQNDTIIQSYRDLALEAGRSGSSIGSHSYAYRTNKRLADSWEKISKLAGKSITQVQDLYNLEPEKLKAIMEGAPVEWSKITTEIRESLEKVIEYGVDKVNEYADALKEALTSISLDDLTSDFEDMLKDMDNDSKNFAENFEEYMRNAIIRTMMTNTYNKALEGWYKDFQEKISDNSLSKDDVNDLREDYMRIVNQALNDRDRLLSVVGNSKNGELSSLQQGIQGITEDQAGALESYMNIVSQKVYEQNSLLVDIREHISNFNMDVQLGTLSQMLLQLQQSYQVHKNIEAILNGVLNPSGRAIVVELNS